MSRPPLPPFIVETAVQKVRLAEDAWNTRDPARVVLAYSSHSSSILPCRGYGPAPSSRRPPMGIAARLRSSGRDVLCRRPATAS